MTVTNKTKVYSDVAPQTFRLVMDDWKMNTVYVCKYPRSQTKPKLVLFTRETGLLDWCRENNVNNAMSGGFFLRNISKPLGEQWIGGQKMSTVSFIPPWNNKRGSLYVDVNGSLQIGSRQLFPKKPETDLLQAGPILVEDGLIKISDGEDPEGMSAGSNQFDDDITVGRFPRAAIGTNDKYIFSVACDGYSQTSDGVGLTTLEFAQFLLKIGVKDALNLDGGSSASIVNNKKLVNKPRGGERDKYGLFEEGRPIFSAIVFEKI